MKFTMLKVLVASLFVSSSLSAQAQGGAAAYPSGSVKLVVPYTPGGITDVVGRALATRLEQTWGKPVIVENKPGASEAVGASYVTKSKPDGLTLFMGSDAAFLVNGLLKKSLTYNPEKDFEPIIRIAEGFAFLVVRPGVQARTLKELLSLAQQNPGKVTFGSEAVGSPSEFRMRILGGLTGGYKMNHIPYNCMNPIIADMLGGRVDSAWLPPHLAKPQIEAKALIPIATNGSKRNWMFPEVPTMIEQGLAGGDLSFKMMLAAPAGTPKAIIDKIAKDVEAILKDPEFDKKSIHSNGYTVLGGTSKDFQDYLNNTRPVLARIVKEAGFTPQ